MLKILILDDSEEKVKRIQEVLSRYEEITINLLHICTNTRDAKQALQEEEFDLLILDIQIPNRSEELPRPQGGVELLREIHSRSRYRKPTCIVGLTEYSDLLDKVEQEFADRLWSIVLYAASSTEWSERLSHKIDYLLEMKRDDKNAHQYGVDLCIITALNVPEFVGLLSLGEWQEELVMGDPMHYWRTSFSSHEKSIGVVAAHAPQMGMPSTAVAATKMIYQFRPRFLAMVGISAGIPGQVNIGDLVVADPCWDWGSGKQRGTPFGVRFDPDPLQERLCPSVRAMFEDVKRDSSLLSSCWTDYHNSKPNDVPKLHIGHCASGACVLADGHQRDEIQEHSRKLMGIDMEAYGLMHAANYATSPAPKAFSMKAVCDFADSKKNDGFQEYGSNLSATVLRRIALKYF